MLGLGLLRRAARRRMEMFERARRIRQRRSSGQQPEMASFLHFGGVTWAWPSRDCRQGSALERASAGLDLQGSGCFPLSHSGRAPVSRP